MERIGVDGGELLEAFRRLVHEGIVRRIAIKQAGPSGGAGRSAEGRLRGARAGHAAGGVFRGSDDDSRTRKRSSRSCR
jgi:hypothetical protein